MDGHQKWVGWAVAHPSFLTSHCIFPKKSVIRGQMFFLNLERILLFWDQNDHSEAKIDHLAGIFVIAFQTWQDTKEEAEEQLRSWVFHLSTAFSQKNHWLGVRIFYIFKICRKFCLLRAQGDHSEAKIDHLAGIFLFCCPTWQDTKKEAEGLLRSLVFRLPTAFSQKITN